MLMLNGYRISMWGLVGAAASVGVGVVGCAPRATVPPPAASEAPYNWETEGNVPPLDESDVKREVDQVDTFEEMEVADTGVAAEDFVVENPTPAPADAGQRFLPGYRVQVFASGSAESAEVMRREVEAKVGQATYVVRADGILKVQAGDFLARSDAEAFLATCREAGYPDAWIVQTDVVAPKPKG